MKLVFILFFSLNLWANQNFIPLPILKRGDKLLEISKRDIEIKNQDPLLRVDIIREVSWERTPQNLLIPFVKISITDLNQDHQKFHFSYKGKSYFPHHVSQRDVAIIDYSLFELDKIEIFKNGISSGSLSLKIKADQRASKTVLEDYSCSGYDVEVYGFEGEYLSLGCEIIRETIDGEVIPSLKLHWITSDFRTIDKETGPHFINFLSGRKALITVENEEGLKKEILFKVNFPERIHKLNTALGLGPYVYKNDYGELSSEKKTFPSFMFYGNYYLNNIHSFKFFNALVMRESVFNHAGLYIGSEIGKFYDDRLVFNTLLGLQALSYRFDNQEDGLFSQIIYPQGLEIVMHHPWDLENYKFSIGGFLSPQPDITYQNFWFRFGGKVFLEFNYINWQYEKRAASMYGLSIGFPFFKAF